MKKVEKSNVFHFDITQNGQEKFMYSAIDSTEEHHFVEAYSSVSKENVLKFIDKLLMKFTNCHAISLDNSPISHQLKHNEKLNQRNVSLYYRSQNINTSTFVEKYGRHLIRNQS